MRHFHWRARLPGPLASLLLACGGPLTDADETVGSVVIAAVDAPVWLGDSTRLTATVRTTTGAVTMRPVAWSSSDSAIATIRQNGTLSGLRVGTVIVRAAAGDAADSTTVLVLAPKVEGTAYALVTIGQTPVPVLLTDYTSPDGYRHRRWIVSDTVRFKPDGSIRYARTDRFGDTEPGAAEILDDVTTSGGGYFEQVDQYVAIAWNWITLPPPGTRRDTLELKHLGLVRRMATPPACLVCPPGPLLELVYRRF